MSTVALGDIPVLYLPLTRDREELCGALLYYLLLPLVDHDVGGAEPDALYRVHGNIVPHELLGLRVEFAGASCVNSNRSIAVSYQIHRTD